MGNNGGDKGGEEAESSFAGSGLSSTSKELCSPKGKRLSGSCASTRAAGEAAPPAPWLGLSSLLLFQSQLVLISKVTSQYHQAAGLLSPARGMG